MVRGFVYDVKTGTLTGGTEVTCLTGRATARCQAGTTLWHADLLESRSSRFASLSLVTWVACFLVAFSMYGWPDMPTSPRPAEGRVYPLNDHVHYTYMNEWEHNLHEALWMAAPFLCLGMFLIHWFVDPFELKRRRRFGLPPPEFR